MSNNPTYPPPGGQRPYGPPPGGQPPYGPPGPYPQGGYNQPQPYGPPGGQLYGAPYGPPGYLPPNQPSKRWYQRWWVWLLAIVAVLVILLVVLELLFGAKFQLEDKIKDAFKAQGVSATNVQCPDSINTDAGHTYICTADIQGTPSTLNVLFDSDRHFIVSVQR